MIVRAIASPIPMPLCLVVKNGSKISLMASGRIPGPLSETDSSAVPSSRRSVLPSCWKVRSPQAGEPDRYRVHFSVGAIGEGRLWARLGKVDLDLILVPAKTDKLSGYNRVFGCAAARAVELQTVVCAVGAVGSPLGHPAFDTVMGGASVYVPCDSAVEPTGIAASLGASNMR